MLTKSETSTQESLKITEAERMKWSQTSNLVWPQMDKQLVDHLSRKLEMQSKTDNGLRRGSVNPMPKGAGMFVFCIFKGKRNPIQTFIDT